MVRLVLVAQIVTILFLFAESLYICSRRSSKMQILMLITCLSTMLMLIGYTIEITARDESTAMLGVGVAYLGKPYAMLASLLFIADYCGRKVPPAVSFALAAFDVIFPALIFTNSRHHLYYSWVDFDRSRLFSPLKLGHSPLYYLYMAMVVLSSLITLWMTVKEYRAVKNKEGRHQILYLFGMVFSSVVGYIIFLSGTTKGYDTTMVGAIMGTILLSVLFFRYRLFDSLTLAKEQALADANSGVLVLDSQDHINYANVKVRSLMPSTFDKDELAAYLPGTTLVQKGDYVYEVSVTEIVDKGMHFGKTFEISDITASLNYSSKLKKEVAARTGEILRIQRSIVSSFAGIVEARDNSTGEHIVRMSTYVGILARSLRDLGYYPEQLTEEYITSLVDVAPLHDIGKISIPDRILLKPGKLTDEEFEIIKTHTTMGAQVIDQCLSGVERPAYVTLAREVALCHHEKWDGSGYPRRLAGDEIPLSGLIVGVADVYDAIRSVRCYKPAMSRYEAKQVIFEGRGSHFSPVVVEAFEHALAEIEAVVPDEND